MEISNQTSRRLWTCIKRNIWRHMEKGWVAVMAGTAASEAEMRAMVVARTGADAENPPAVISPLIAHPNHTFRGGQMGSERANRPLWSMVQVCVGINGAVQCWMEPELLCSAALEPGQSWAAASQQRDLFPSLKEAAIKGFAIKPLQNFWINF